MTNDWKNDIDPLSPYYFSGIWLSDRARAQRQGIKPTAFIFFGRYFVYRLFWAKQPDGSFKNYYEYHQIYINGDLAVTYPMKVDAPKPTKTQWRYFNDKLWFKPDDDWIPYDQISIWQLIDESFSFDILAHSIMAVKASDYPIDGRVKHLPIKAGEEKNAFVRDPMLFGEGLENLPANVTPNLANVFAMGIQRHRRNEELRAQGLMPPMDE
jgi:hypothetical protein